MVLRDTKKWVAGTVEAFEWPAWPLACPEVWQHAYI